MNLTVRIHEKEYRNTCVQGITFCEEYNETLDSATIKITHEQQIDKLRPYDDVLIYDSDYDEEAYSTGETKPNELSTFDAQLAAWRTGGDNYDGIKYSGGQYVSGTQPFYRHFLIDQYTENIINLSEGIYSYTIELMSETKGLEAVQLPNISITQPLLTKNKKTIKQYLIDYLSNYSPYYKLGSNFSWTYAQKYTLDPAISSAQTTHIFAKAYTQDFSPSNPTLRDVLSQLMLTCDMIPYVKDNVVYAKDITKRTAVVDLEQEKAEGKINYVSANMTSNDYCDSVRRQYSGAISSTGRTRYTEYLGFRNKNNAIMTLEDLQVETTFPIYKVNKMYMCFYKRVYIREGGDVTNQKYPAYFLCKQDITPLVKLSSEWAFLSQDWSSLSDVQSVSDLSKYKFATTYYTQNSNIIGGWGFNYNAPGKDYKICLMDINRTYIQNILIFMNYFYPYGISTKEQVLRDLGYKSDLSNIHVTTTSSNVTNDDVGTDLNLGDLSQTTTANTRYGSGCLYTSDNTFGSLDAGAIRMKGIFFEVDYDSYYSGALLHSRDNGLDNIVHNDNSSSSLALLEKDGFNQKEKMNRFANKTYLIKGRVKSVDEILPLGATMSIGYDDDVIIFRREYSIYDNMITVAYAGIQDYVLKNYYTSVYAKYRTYQLMSYSEAVERSENRKAFFLLSKNKRYFDDLSVYDLSTSKLFSAFDRSSIMETIGVLDTPNAINCSYLQPSNTGGSAPSVVFYDTNIFTSGQSLCLNTAMTDNISGGNYIQKWTSDYQLLGSDPSDDSDYVKGSVQDWYNITNKESTGKIGQLSTATFNFAHLNRPSFISAAFNISRSTPAQIQHYIDNNLTNNSEVTWNNIYSKLQSLPAKQSGDVVSNVISAVAFDKDNKERINMTCQFEPISDEKNNIVFSEWFMKLSDLSSKYIKVTNDYTRYVPASALKYEWPFGPAFPKNNTTGRCGFYIQTNLPNDWESMSIGDELPIFNFHLYLKWISNNHIEYFIFDANYLKKNSSTSFEVKGSGSIRSLGANGTVTETALTSLGFEYYSDIPAYRYVYSGDFTGRYQSTGWFFDTIVYNAGTADAQAIYMNKNLYCKLSQDNVSIDDVYNESITSPGFSNTSVESVFYVKGSGEGSNLSASYILLDLASLGDLSNVKSIQCWYCDDIKRYTRHTVNNVLTYEKSGSADDESYHFVFGINLTDEDKETGYVKIFISTMKQRDTRIFDSLGRHVGVLYNAINLGDYAYEGLLRKYIPAVIPSSHTMTITIPEHITRIYYKIGTANYVYTDTSTTAQVAPGETVYAYPVAETGYGIVGNYSAENPYVATQGYIPLTITFNVLDPATFTIVKNEHIAKIYWKYSGDESYTEVTASTVINIPLEKVGSNILCYATAESGYYYDEYTQSSPKSITIAQYGQYEYSPATREGVLNARWISDAEYGYKNPTSSSNTMPFGYSLPDDANEITYTVGCEWYGSKQPRATTDNVVWYRDLADRHSAVREEVTLNKTTDISTNPKYLLTLDNGAKLYGYFASNGSTYPTLPSNAHILYVYLEDRPENVDMWVAGSMWFYS